MKPNRKTENLLGDTWRTALLLINAVVLFIVLAFGYFLLEDHIDEYVNRKKYSPEELEKLSNRIRTSNKEDNYNKIKNGIHLGTGLHADPNLKTIIASCTSCHSAKLITQNKATREGWKSMIDWMQETQGLPDLGKEEPVILNYLAKYYAPTNTGRRKNLDMAEIEWYILDL